MRKPVGPESRKEPAEEAVARSGLWLPRSQVLAFWTPVEEWAAVVPTAAREKAELVFLQHASADTLAKVVQEWLAGRAVKAPAQPGQAAQTGGLVVADARLNALVVFGSDKDKEEVKRFVALLDVPPPTASSKVNVYYLENADAIEVAKVLDGVVKGSAVAAAPVPGQPAAPPQQSPFEGGKITITPDKATNSLVIMASTNWRL